MTTDTVTIPRVLYDLLIEACAATDTGDDDPCYYDHHGYCQAHGLQPKGGCYMELVRLALKMAEEYVVQTNSAR